MFSGTLYENKHFESVRHYSVMNHCEHVESKKF
jgi:hypothetical protein